LDNENVEAVNTAVVEGRVEISEPKEPGIEDASPFVASAGFVEICLDVPCADTSLQRQYQIKHIIHIFDHEPTIDMIANTYANRSNQNTIT